MALIKCTECGKDISDKAASCPNCGVPIDPNDVSRFFGGANNKIPVDTPAGSRRCLRCSYVGPMKTWLRNHNAPQVIALVLLFFWIIPGLIFIAWGWGKYKCPQCGALDNSMPV
jgi:predicted RNA-binding Zn-ribbon protein involved in translation (DUF1610 family)